MAWDVVFQIMESEREAVLSKPFLNSAVTMTSDGNRGLRRCFIDLPNTWNSKANKPGLCGVCVWRWKTKTSVLVLDSRPKICKFNATLLHLLDGRHIYTIHSHNLRMVVLLFCVLCPHKCEQISCPPHVHALRNIAFFLLTLHRPCLSCNEEDVSL
jgi:hypothetical protein